MATVQRTFIGLETHSENMCRSLTDIQVQQCLGLEDSLKALGYS